MAAGAAHRSYLLAAELAASVVLAELAASEVLAELAASEVSAELAASEVSAELAASEAQVESGSITRSIGAARRIKIGRLQTALGARLAEIRWLIARLEQDNRLASKAETWRAIEPEVRE
jgi:hypothetical protein